jgi:hypothetical protein
MLAEVYRCRLTVGKYGDIEPSVLEDLDMYHKSAK